MKVSARRWDPGMKEPFTAQERKTDGLWSQGRQEKLNQEDRMRLSFRKAATI